MPESLGGRSGPGPGAWVLLLLLAVAAGGVLVLLPRWVAGESEPGAVAGSAPGTTVAAEPSTPDSNAETPIPETPPPDASIPNALSLDSRSSDPPTPDARPSDPPARNRPPETPPARTVSAAPAERSTAAPGRQSRADDAFARAMGRGFGFLAAEDFPAAKEAFDEAERTAVGDVSASLADARAQLATAERLARIQRLRAEAAGHEEAEAWREAEAVYRQVLAIDGSIAFARQGVERSGERARLRERLAFYLDRPERLQTAEVLEEAQRWVDRASLLEDPGPGLAAQRAELEKKVREYAVPVPAEIRSDQLTSVWVYKVAKLGTFASKTLELRPGVYTVVGSREGYRDVRIQWTIEPGKSPEPLLVRCDQEI